MRQCEEKLSAIQGQTFGSPAKRLQARLSAMHSPAAFRDAVFATQAIQHNADFLLG
ncbi:MAG TPA: hypothetical protein VIE66_11695 [Methylocella sp.]|jgi:hypothetical protein